MEQKRISRKAVIIAASVLVVLLAAAAILLANRPSAAAQGAKEIQASVYVDDTLRRAITIHTDAEFLRAALEQENLISGDEGEFGLFVKTVDGITVDDSAMQWWCFTKNGETLFTGVQDTPIADGDAFEITLITGY